MKSIAIMQPYFFPYIGYFQLINSVDEFVIYDNIKYTKRGWINRNRLLLNGKDSKFSIPLKNDSDKLDIVERKLADNWKIERKKLLNKINESYKKAPFFDEIYNLLLDCIMIDESNLFIFIYESLSKVNKHIDINTPMIISSTIDIDHDLKSENKVISIVKKRNATTYINAIGGMELYDKDKFKEYGINLKFIKTHPINYIQFKNEFVPWLSIIDVMMHNSKDTIKEYLKLYTLI